MKQSMLVLFPLVILLIGFMACKTANDSNITQNKEERNVNADTSSGGGRLKISIGSKTFKAALGSNQAVAAFKARMPMTAVMSELNGNEKLFNFSSKLPTNASNPGTIHAGDLMIYGSSTLVLFYKSFPTQYSYTRLGRIEDASGLAKAVGAGNVTITFELE
ncbi:cyclophilin-like fold protein [Dyadobacter subterraneus]|uniref:Cyclophilin-like domain-containing protein n=1 Tax=Dyadobacter subterraneus TaxID=2773304 RepID=A0ABR9WEM6_9BACT|nr:cyclophilin-like fold protein [Dyadobacter subterraneus]MBE9463877.1 hypothetical protein [Dyadobacter subterraneus]